MYMRDGLQSCTLVENELRFLLTDWNGQLTVDWVTYAIN